VICSVRADLTDKITCFHRRQNEELTTAGWLGFAEVSEFRLGVWSWCVDSLECRHLLTKVVIVEAFTRITMQAVGCVNGYELTADSVLPLPLPLLLLLLLLQGIKEHPWYTAELPPFLQQALDDLQLEQVKLCGLVLHANQDATTAPHSPRLVVLSILQQALHNLQLEQMTLWRVILDIQLTILLLLLPASRRCVTAWSVQQCRWLPTATTPLHPTRESLPPLTCS
jgi:hypothetical protein